MEKDPEFETMYTLQEIASALRVHIKSVRRWVNSGQLVAFNAGQGYRVRKSAFEDFVRKREQRDSPRKTKDK